MFTDVDSKEIMNDLEGKWFGRIMNGGRESEVKVNFTNLRVVDASICLPGHNGKFISLTNADYRPPKVHFEYVTTDARGVFDGTLSNNKITGSFSENGGTGNFELKKEIDEDVKKDETAHVDLRYPYKA